MTPPGPRLWQPPSRTAAPLLFGRRTLLTGAGAALLLSACGSDEDGAVSQSSSTADGSATPTSELQLVPDESVLYFQPLFNAGPGYLQAGREQRLVFGLLDVTNTPVTDGPREIAIQLRFEGKPQSADEYLNEMVGDPIMAVYHDEGLPRGYYEFRFVPDRDGIWSGLLTVDDQELDVAFQVDADADVALYQIGQTITAVETATLSEPLGIDPICTRDPQCSLHDQSFAAALTAGKPTALLISTPAYCQVGICGPVLDLLIAAATESTEITFIHAEVYANPNEVASIDQADLAGVVEFVGLTYEPSLFLVNGNGIVVDRLDNIWDAEEQATSLAKLSA